jgi:hypothetical protein
MTFRESISMETGKRSLDAGGEVGERDEPREVQRTLYLVQRNLRAGKLFCMIVK